MPAVDHCREQSAVNGADVIAAEKILEIGGDGGEASAVHREQHSGDEHKERHGIQMRGAGIRQQRVEYSAKGKENHVGRFAAM